MSEYLTIAEAAELLRLSVQSVRDKMSRKIFLCGVHYFSRPGEIGPRFKRSVLVAWLEAGTKKKAGRVIPMARNYLTPVDGKV